EKHLVPREAEGCRHSSQCHRQMPPVIQMVSGQSVCRGDHFRQSFSTMPRRDWNGNWMQDALSSQRLLLCSVGHGTEAVWMM
ncbi:hypothetical protein NDU88_003253, partial [Pleurodeles waltl]